MKKTYSIPETKVVVIKTMNMMAASPNILLDSSKSVSAGSIESRQDNSWDIWGTGDYDEE